MKGYITHAALAQDTLQLCLEYAHYNAHLQRQPYCRNLHGATIRPSSVWASVLALGAGVPAASFFTPAFWGVLSFLSFTSTDLALASSDEEEVARAPTKTETNRHSFKMNSSGRWREWMRKWHETKDFLLEAEARDVEGNSATTETFPIASDTSLFGWESKT